MTHFGVNLRDSDYGFYITREKYAIIDNKSSVRENYTWTDEMCIKHQKRCLENYDLNMEYFSKLDKEEFVEAIDKFVNNYKFTEVFDLNQYALTEGYYMLVLDKYKQAYIGTTGDVKKRIMTHWSKVYHLMI